MIANSWSIAFSVLALACSALCLWRITRTDPTALARSLVKQATEIAARWEEERALFAATREGWTQEFHRISEGCDEVLDRAESKRRRAAASASRANGDPGAMQEVTREQILSAARRRMLGGGG